MKKEKKSSEFHSEDNFVLSNMSHEIRTPMNAIMGLTEMLFSRTKDIEQKEYINAIRIASKNLLMVINNLTDYEEMVNHGTTVNNGEFDFSELVEEVIEIVRINVDEKNVRFLVDTNIDYPGKVIGDETKIKQILVHLLNNAVKFTNEGYIIFKVRTHINKDNTSTVEVTISDTGIGMSKELMENIYNPFTQKDETYSRKAEGLGIGLTIAKEFLRLFGSELKVESREGEGTTFSFALTLECTKPGTMPAVKSAAEKNVAILVSDDKEAEFICNNLSQLSVSYKKINGPGDLFVSGDDAKFTHLLCDYMHYMQIRDINELAELNLKKVCLLGYYTEIRKEDDTLFIRNPLYFKDLVLSLNADRERGLISNGIMERKSEASFSLPGVRILLVDDNAINLRVMAGLMKPYALTADIACSGEEAIRLIRRTKYDLVFMDHMMPGMDGAQAVKIIRDSEEAYFLKLPIIALTANVLPGVKELLLSAGMNDFLPKPVTIAELEAMLKKWIPQDKFKEAVETMSEADNQIDEVLLNFKHINVEQGLSYTGGNLEMYRAVLKDFAGATDKKKEQLKTFIDNDDISAFTIEVHSLKSTAKTLGAQTLSEMAQDLERMGHVRDYDGIKNKVGRLLDEITHVAEDLKEFRESLDEPGIKKVPLNRDTAREALRDMFYAMDDFDYDKGMSLVKLLQSFELDEEASVICNNLYEAVDKVDYSRAKALSAEFLAYL